MLEIAHFLLFFSVAVALIVIYIAAQLYKEYHFKYLRSNLFMFIGFSIITLSNTIETYLKIIIPDYYTSFVHEVFGTIVLFILPPIVIFATYNLVSLIWGLLGKNLNSIIKKIAFFIVSILILGQIIFFINPRLIVNLQYLSSIIAHAVLFITIGGSLIYMFFSIKSIKNKGRKKALNLFTIVLSSFLLFLFLIALSGIKKIISPNSQTVFLSILVFAFNLFIAFFIKKFFKKYYKDYMISDESYFNGLINRYNITKREKEIITLVCNGLTNKDIAEELFITPLTVRDHISKIFKNVKVKSRLQLANLFRA